MSDVEIDSFIKRLLDERLLAGKTAGLTDELRGHMVADMKERLFDQIDRALIDALPAGRMGEFNRLLDNEASDEQMQRFIVESGIDIAQVTSVAKVELCESYGVSLAVAEHTR